MREIAGALIDGVGRLITGLAILALIAVVGLVSVGTYSYFELKNTKQELREQQLLRLVEPVIMPFASDNKPGQYMSDVSDKILWFCYNFAHRTPTGYSIVNCKLDPSIELSSLNQHVEETEDDRDIFHALIMIFRGYNEKSVKGDGGYKIINEILSGKTIHVTVYGFESGDETVLPLHPNEPGKGEGMDSEKSYEKAVTMRFTIEISSETLKSRDGSERIPLRKYSQPTFEFHK
ncbi:MAG: hypothetical protein V4690_04355 [Patescibacteria group bacterium]